MPVSACAANEASNVAAVGSLPNAARYRSCSRASVSSAGLAGAIKTSGAKGLAVGGSHACAITGSNGVQCWGSNSSGQLGDMMEAVATFYDEEINRLVDMFTRLFEPLLMTVIGGVIGGIVLLLYMPIFELAGNFQ